MIRKTLQHTVLALILAGTFASCQKTSLPEEEVIANGALTQDEKTLVTSAGFNGGWAEKTPDGKFLIEGDILLTAEQLKAMVGVAPTNNFIIGNEEHYRTTNLVATNGIRTITVSLGGGFPSYYSTGLDQALARYNGLANSNIRFQRVASGGEIHISGANLGRSFGGGCILGQAAGFPSGGNPSAGFTLSTSKCATSYLNTANKADEVIAHEIGHCIGFRHTDYMNRISCGSNSNEGDGGVGAIHITGTITNVTSANYNSWMMACTNGSPVFSAEDNYAIEYVY